MKKRSKRPKQASLASLKAKAWKLLSECVRHEAAAPGDTVNCYTCGAMHHWKELQAGHAIGGRTGAVLLDEEIIRPCCERCNIWLRGNYQEFSLRLIREKAKQLTIDGATLVPLTCAVDWWEQKLSSARQVRKWTRSELQDKIDSYKARLERLQS